MRASASFILLTNSQSRPRDLQDQDGLDQWEAGTELKVNMKLLQCWAGLGWRAARVVIDEIVDS